ncbi:MAG: FtsX-like permease family protein [Brevinematales bacterium]|nr:FtsX-like permease family protein [Brevinematales bacterium]
MYYLLSIAIKNLVRSKRRTFFTFLILSVGIIFYIFMDGIIKGYKTQSINNFIQFDTGHIKIRSENFDKEDPYNIENFINNPKEVKEILSKKSYIKAYTERIQFLAEADNGKDSLPVVVVGVDYESDSKVFTLTNYIIKGSFVTGEALIGDNLAKDMGVDVGDSIYLTFRNKYGTIDSVEVYISGILFTADPVVNSSSVFISLDDAKSYLATESVTEISIITENYKRDKKFIEDLKKNLKGFKIESWRELVSGIEAASKQDEITTYIFVFFILVIAIVGIINTMLMSVYEKMKEIGTLKALGMTDEEVKTIFVLEGLIIGIIGGLLGIIIGALVNWYFVRYGIDYTALIGKENENIMASLRLVGIVKSKWDVSTFVYAFLISVLTSTLASYYPAKKTTLMQPAEALRSI